MPSHLIASVCLFWLIGLFFPAFSENHSGMGGTGSAGSGEGKKLVVIDQDCAGPGGTNMQSLLALLNAPDVKVLGITVPTGDGWRDDEVRAAKKLLEDIGRTDVPVYPGAVFPLSNTPELVRIWEKQFGTVMYKGAWDHAELRPSEPVAQSHAENEAAKFLVKSVREHPGEVTIMALGPLTNVACAMELEPKFAELAAEIVIMGGSIDPTSQDPQTRQNPKREFNFWMDPEASHLVLRAKWQKMSMSPLDVAERIKLTPTMIEKISKSKSLSAQYVARYVQETFLWDEIAVILWLKPELVTRSEKLYVDVSCVRDKTYGDTLVWKDGAQHPDGLQLMEVNFDLNTSAVEDEFVALMSR